MKTCPYCKIEVGGDLVKCPLCQSRITGESEAAYFPKPTSLKIRSFFYKIQLFLVWIIVIVGLGLDFFFHISIPPFNTLHWSLLLAMWLMVIEFGIMRQFKPGTGSARKVTMMVFIILVMLAITSYFFHFMRLAFAWIIPITLSVTMVVNFILAMIDKKGNAMAYLLTNLLVGMLSFTALYFRNKGISAPWIICMMMSVILFVGAVIFKGQSVMMEITRRFNV